LGGGRFCVSRLVIVVGGVFLLVISSFLPHTHRRVPYQATRIVIRIIIIGD